MICTASSIGHSAPVRRLCATVRLTVPHMEHDRMMILVISATAVILRTAVAIVNMIYFRSCLDKHCLSVRIWPSDFWSYMDEFLEWTKILDFTEASTRRSFHVR
jgi:hypothetical protein